MTQHQGVYSTWSDPIMAKEQVWTPICSFTTSVVILKYYDAFEMD